MKIKKIKLFNAFRPYSITIETVIEHNLLINNLTDARISHYTSFHTTDSQKEFLSILLDQIGKYSNG